MKKFITAVLVSLAAAFLIVTSNLEPHITPLIIHNDPGGLVIQEIGWYTRIKNAGIPVKVDGECTSACTIFLGLGGKVCVTDNAKFGFHAIYDIQQQHIYRNESLKIFGHFYPKPIMDWYTEKVIGKYDQEALENDNKVINTPVYLNAKQLVEMGVKHC